MPKHNNSVSGPPRRAPRLLVLGGGAFVGRAVVRLAQEDQWGVTTFSWERAVDHGHDVEHIVGDRLSPANLQALAGRTWDLAVDTWRGSAEAVRASTRLLAGKVGLYAYISSFMVYREAMGRPLSEGDPLVPTSPGLAGESYPARKAAGERAVLAALGERALVARAGLILGPHEYPGRLPWWLQHVSRYPRTLAPGRPDRMVQFVDVRDLAGWLLHCGQNTSGGIYNVSAPRGHATMGQILGLCQQVTGATGRLCWVEDEELLAANIRPWTEMPLWIPSRLDTNRIYDVDVSRAILAGARFRPAAATVRDTWRWLSSLNSLETTQALDRRPWLTRDREEQLLRGYDQVQCDVT